MVSKDDALNVLYPDAVDRSWRLYGEFGNESIEYWNPALGTQPTQAQLDAVTQTQVDAAKLTKLRTAAKQIHLANEAENRALRATVKVLVDELNILRQWMTDMKAATAASTNYASLKSGIGALSNTPQRTYAQARTAIETIIDGEN